MDIFSDIKHTWIIKHTDFHTFQELKREYKALDFPSKTTAIDYAETMLRQGHQVRIYQIVNDERYWVLYK